MHMSKQRFSTMNRKPSQSYRRLRQFFQPSNLRQNKHNPRFRSVVLGFGVLLMSGCGDRSNSTAPQSTRPQSASELSQTLEPKPESDGSAHSRSSHERMLAQLSQLKRRVNLDHPFIGNGKLQILQNQLARLTPNSPLRDQVGIRFELGKEELRLANEERAIEHFQWCLQRLAKIDDSSLKSKSVQSRLLFQLAVAYLRLGETQNCCLRNTPESCILPIGAAAVHKNRKGSEEAIKALMKTLALVPSKSELHWKCRWLLNIAHMTLGDHPAKVPAEFLIPTEAFESQEPFVRFSNVAQKLKLDSFSMCGGVIVDDFDNDNYLDLMVSPWEPNGQLRWFRNSHDGTFAEQTKSSGLKGMPGGLNLIQADYDNDGDTDVLVLRGAWLDGNGRHPNSLLRNKGDGTFEDVTFDAGLDQHYPTQTAAWADYDNDGDLDLFIGNEHNPQANLPEVRCQLYRNQGDGTFKDVASQAGVTNLRYTKACVWGDYDGDRFADLFVSNLHGVNRLYHNNQDGTFTDVAKEAGVAEPSQSFPAWFWDFDNDGNLDLYVSAYSAGISDLALWHTGKRPKSESSALFRGDGTGKFKNVTRTFGLNRPDASMGANFGDIDNDGFLDFYLGTGYPDYASVMPSVMYRNKNGKSFVDITTAGGFGHLQKGHAVAFADFDHDGDQDVFEQMGGAFPGDRFHDALYENPGLGNHWITLRLTGTKSNRSAIGARICATVSEAGKSRKIYRYVTSGGSFGASPLRQTVGLGAAGPSVKLEVYWPTSDTTQDFVDVGVDGHYEVIEGMPDLVPMKVNRFKLGGDK